MSGDGTVIAVGAWQNDDNGINSGHVRIFKFSPSANQWVQRGADLIGESAGDLSGVSIAMATNGDVVAIGANEANVPNHGNAGHVRVFEWNEVSWVQRGTDIDGIGGVDFGISVALSDDGSILAVGDRYSGLNGANSGSVNAFVWTGADFQQRGSQLIGQAAGDQFGISVSLSSDGGIMVVGAIYNDVGGTDSGQVRAFTWTGTLWQQLGSAIQGQNPSDESGLGISLSNDGRTVAIGSRWNDNGVGQDAGHVRIFELVGSMWQPKGPAILGDNPGDNSGLSAALSADGEVVAIGSIYHDGVGSNSGQVRIFIWDAVSGVWIQRGPSLLGGAVDDWFGWAVALSEDGRTVAASGRLNDARGERAGLVQVFQWF